MDSKHYLEDALDNLRKLKNLADKALTQVDKDDFFTVIDAESNSIAIILKHMAGNMRSRWTDFLSSDGEKPDRNRDSEFIIERSESKTEILLKWENGWDCVFDAIESLGPDDLNKTVYIRNEPHSVIQAINRQLSHYAYHVGQIVFLAKHFKTINWRSLSIPKGKSDQFNDLMRKKKPN
jgi:hypothetical protein